MTWRAKSRPSSPSGTPFWHLSSSTGTAAALSTTRMKHGRTKSLSVYRSWTDGTLQTRMPVPSGEGGRLLVAHVGSRETGLVADAGLVVICQKGSGDYHKEVCSDVWLKWLEKKVFPKIAGVVLVIDRAPYHLVLTPESAPAGSKLRKAELAEGLESHDVVPADCKDGWKQSRMRAKMKAVGDKHKPDPRYLVQRLAARFGVSVLISPVAHPDLNPIEMVWGTVKMALKRSNTVILHCYDPVLSTVSRLRRARPWALIGYLSRSKRSGRLTPSMIVP